jgi:hypothetical protein
MLASVPEAARANARLCGVFPRPIRLTAIETAPTTVRRNSRVDWPAFLDTVADHNGGSDSALSRSASSKKCRFVEAGPRRSGSGRRR